MNLMLCMLIYGVSASLSFYVMAPLRLFNENHELVDRDTLISWFSRLSKEAKVDGLMVDIWWGLVETSENNYSWAGYRDLFQLCINANLTILPVMSFHQCGGNIGDECDIHIPSFVYDSQAQPFFKSANGYIDKEYVSFGYDDVMITSRTPLQMYKAFMTSFKNEFSDLITSGVISEIEVGMGPCGELRYPSYQIPAQWQYPGCGSFQSYDDKLSSQASSAAGTAGHPGWGNPGYIDQNVHPDGDDFWRDGTSNGWDSYYGQWFIKWYANRLITHANDVMKCARQAFGSSIRLSGKIPGIHWWYTTGCHCAEVTAGLRNFRFHDGYRDILFAFKNYNFDLCFTCLEMSEDGSCGSNPPFLVEQMAGNAKWANVRFEGENARDSYGADQYNRIKSWLSKGLVAFSYLRLCDTLMSDANFGAFVNFVAEMRA
jgi:beta-amylase